MLHEDFSEDHAQTYAKYNRLLSNTNDEATLVVLTKYSPLLTCLTMSKCLYTAKWKPQDGIIFKLKCTQCAFEIDCSSAKELSKDIVTFQDPYDSQLSTLGEPSITKMRFGWEELFDRSEMGIKMNMITMLPVMAFHSVLGAVPVAKWMSYASDESKVVRNNFASVIADVICGIEVTIFSNYFLSISIKHFVYLASVILLSFMPNVFSAACIYYYLF